MPRAKKTAKMVKEVAAPNLEIQVKEAPIDVVSAPAEAPKSKSRKMAFKKLESLPDVVPQQELSRIQLEPETTDSVDLLHNEVIAINPSSTTEILDTQNVNSGQDELLNNPPQDLAKAKKLDKSSVLEFSQDMKEYLVRQEKVMEEMTQMMRHVYNHTKRQQTLAKARLTVFVIIGIIFAIIGSVFAPTFKKAFVQYNDVLKIGGGGVKEGTVETIFDKPK